MIYYVTDNIEIFTNNIYKVITVEESLKLLDTWKQVQFDTETTGLDCFIKKLLLMQFGDIQGKNQIVIDCTTIDPLKYKYYIENTLLIGHNLKFDLKFLYTINIIPTKVYDTMIVEQLLYLGYPTYGKYGGISYSLAAVVDRYLNINIDKTIREEIIWRGIDTKVIEYSANDVVYLGTIAKEQLEKCKIQDCTIGAKLECNFVPVIAYLEWCGIRLNVDKWTDKIENNKKDLTIKKNKLDSLIISYNNPSFFTVNRQGNLFEGFDILPKCTVNWNSSAQVIKVFKYLGFNTSTKDKKTNKEKDSVLEKLIKPQKGINDDFLNIYLEYQEFSKLCSTYGENYIDTINPITERIHTTFRQLGTTSGRMACGSKKSNIELAEYKKMIPSRCTYVQLQNLPADENTRSSFIPNKDNIMCSCDYAALESRLGADIYNDIAMLTEYLTGSGDIHSLVAKGCFPEELKDINIKDIKKLRPDLRKKAKAPEFACQFGGGWNAIMGSLSCSKKEAIDIENNYYNMFQGISEFKKIGSKKVKETGYVLMCTHTGHKMYWWDHNYWLKKKETYTKEFWDNYRELKNTLSKEDWEEHPIRKDVSNHFKASSKWERMALNAPTQGSGIIILKDAMIKFFKYIIENNLFGKVLICNLVHDEAVIEFPKTMLHIETVLVKFMEDSAAIYCKKLPIPAESAIGDHWIH